MSIGRPGGQFGRKSLPKLADLPEKWKCIEYIGKSKIWTKTSPQNPEIFTKFLPLWKL